MNYAAGMVTVAQCPSVDEALMLKSLLEGSGITAFVPDELTAQTAPPYLFASSSGVRVQVAEEDAETALALIAETGHTADADES
ncbi:MAG: putative prokaryotic signal transducing protein [Verrucomicrobiota bacterium]|jgi:hypothetical protein|nr:DUF2007 domain-containing protein [Opitutaceae bacterium]HRK66535.1 DUF2007 domain-containing protein [Hyphomonas sp.]